MVTVLTATSGLFRDRDFFVHDGTQLRRFRLSASIQCLALAVLLALVAWSSYAVARFVTPAPIAISAQASSSKYSAQIAQLTAETERRVQIIEQRQMALARASWLYRGESRRGWPRRPVRRQCRSDVQAIVH
jgi:hypothetical protein